MYNVLTLNKIAAVGTKRLGDNYTCGNDVQDPDAILVRSAAMHDMEFGDNLLAIARAGAGTNNIPKDKCTEQGICVFNTPGANANAVKELVLTGLLLASRKVVEGIEWAKTLKGSGDEMGKKVEKGKSQFVGPEITGKTLGVVGLGAIGILVANVAVAVGMDVIGFDPFLSEANKAKLDPAVKIMGSNEEVMVNCDYLSIHVPLLPDTKDMVDAEMIAKMRDGVRILNYSRDGLVNSEACDRFRQRHHSRRGKCHCHSAPRRFHSRIRGQLRGDGVQPDQGLYRERQHRQFCQPPCAQRGEKRQPRHRHQQGGRRCKGCQRGRHDRLQHQNPRRLCLHHHRRRDRSRR